jgi:hypothetical protein
MVYCRAMLRRYQLSAKITAEPLCPLRQSQPSIALKDDVRGIKPSRAQIVAADPDIKLTVIAATSTSDVNTSPPEVHRCDCKDR